MRRVRTLPSRVQMAPARVARQVNPDSWRGDKTTAERGYGSKWRRFRERFLREHPLCVMCEQAGRVEAATVVDHIEPHRGDMGLFWKDGNHQALCKACHDGRKQREERRLGPGGGGESSGGWRAVTGRPRTHGKFPL